MVMDFNVETSGHKSMVVTFHVVIVVGCDYQRQK